MRPFFLPHDGRLLQEAVWHRDISRWAIGDSFEPLARAEALFDWTIRNVQLDPDSDKAAPHRPWQTLLYGHGTAAQRAWVFALLCRQQGLDVVMLSVAAPTADSSADPSDQAKPASGNKQILLPALFVDGQLYLFDTRLGLPIPGPDGAHVATLQQVQADDALLRQLDLPDKPYLLSAEQMKHAVAYVVADPFDLTRRARQMESKLSGDDQLALSVNATALADRLKTVPQVADVRIWELPFITLRDQLSLNPSLRVQEKSSFEPFAYRPTLWKARTRSFQGRRQRTENSRKDDEELIDDHREAAQFYASKEVRPTDREISREGGEDRAIVGAAKLNATYFLGLLKFDEADFDTSADWLKRPELTAAGSPWKTGARYNLARALEAQDKLDEAIAILEADKSPQQDGNQLRARMLKARAAAAPKAAE